MKVLIVGGTSSIGISLKPVLSAFCEVITAGRTNSDIHFDLNDPVSAMELPSGIDVVILLAAHLGGKTEEEIEAAERLNVLGSLKLCQVASKAKVKHFIFVSSIFALLKETSPFYNAYAISKKHAEEILRYDMVNKPMLLTILRPSQIYGNDKFRANQPFFYSIIDKAEKGEEILLYGANDASRNYLHIEDLVHILSEIVRNSTAGVFNCSYPENITYSQIAKAAISAFGSGSEVRFLSDKPDVPDNIFDMDDTLYKKLGFYPRISIEEGMKKIAASRKALT